VESSTPSTEDAVGRVGFIGLGDIGKPMAKRLASWPGGLTVFDIAPEPVAELAAAGAEAAGTVEELAASCSVISIMVRTDDQVRMVFDQICGSAQPGTVVAIHSTISPELPAELAKVAESHGLMVVDAPVSGGAMGAGDGTLAILVGGPSEAFTKLHGPFDLMAAEVMHCGDLGAGTAAKLARNLLHYIAFTATGEAMRLAEAAGIDIPALGRIIRHTDAITGGPGSVIHRTTAAPMEPGDPWIPIFQHPLALGTKDLTHAIEMAERLGVEVPMGRYALRNLGPALGLSAPTEDAVGDEDA
jgi:3-hydroxyisobutyrate dehydrogenase